MNFTQIEKHFIENGWVLIRTIGSHYQYKKIGENTTAIIPDYGQKDLPLDIVKRLEKTTGLSLVR